MRDQDVVQVWKEQGLFTAWPWTAVCSFGDCDWGVERKRWRSAYGLALAHARTHRRSR